MQTSLRLSSNTIVLIDNFINKHFSNKSNEQIQELKKEAIEIVNSIAEESAKDKESLKEQLATKEDIILTRKEISDSKYDLLKWLVTAQLAIAGLLLALIKLI
ncbi:hypothetical protein [Helicobacter turcicus]|uniref:DUF1640 domain-containing protein n=1 Tax=Helicobacter turcicus TaxID=2867412 RepID=A0ABS7JPC0_9HELI|nr:hypothetical protein [Helicobacter turcicus]MBX7491242.1 hypothetical protein [Helicobacter turcicus]MBX7546119.1 hypothetical protein [Helicobacter turcicus]